MRTVSASLLKQLLANGSVPASAVGRSGMGALRALFDTGALERARVGAGSVIAVRRRQAVEALARQLYPSGLDAAALVGTLPPRAAAVAAVRDAKRGRRGAAEPVLFRAFYPATLVGQPGGELDLLALTRLAGVAAVTLTPQTSWRFAGRLGIVENLEVFYHVERIAPALDAALYAGGRLSERVVQWLAGETMGATELTHFGDYDPVGLAEYLRLRHSCGPRTALFIPPDLPLLMHRFGKHSLLSGRNADLMRKLRAEADPTVRAVVALIDATGCGLEQEALLIEASP